MHRARYGEGVAKFPCPVWASQPPSNSMSSTQKFPKLHQLGFLKISVWLFMIKSTPSPSVLPRSLGVELKVLDLKSRLGLSDDQRLTYHPVTHESPKVLGALCQVLGTKTKYFSHYTTSPPLCLCVL